MGKTQFDRFNDNVWKRQLASEQKKNAKHKAAKELKKKEADKKNEIIWRTIYYKKPR